MPTEDSKRPDLIPANISTPSTEPAEDIVKVLRVVEYVGPRSLVESQVTRSIHGTRTNWGSQGKSGLQISAATLGTFPEVLDQAHRSLDPMQAAEMSEKIDQLAINRDKALARETSLRQQFDELSAYYEAQRLLWENVQSENVDLQAQLARLLEKVSNPFDDLEGTGVEVGEKVG